MTKSKPIFKKKRCKKIRITMCLRRRAKESRMRSWKERTRSPRMKARKKDITVDSG